MPVNKGKAQQIDAMAYEMPNTNIDRPSRVRPPRLSLGRFTIGSNPRSIATPSTDQHDADDDRGPRASNASTEADRW